MAILRNLLLGCFAAVLTVSLVGCGGKNKNEDLASGENGYLSEDILSPELDPELDGTALGGGGMPGERMMDLGAALPPDMFAPVYFTYDSSNLAPAELSKAQAVADYMRGNSAVQLVLEGHADERGSREYNLGLGERRALAVRGYLVQVGVDAMRVQTRSFGEEQPAVFGHDESAWAQNRRVEFKLFE